VIAAQRPCIASTERGLCFTADEVTDPALLRGLDEANFMKFRLFRVRKSGGEHEREAPQPETA
jgi:hypothetical protein